MRSKKQGTDGTAQTGAGRTAQPARRRVYSRSLPMIDVSGLRVQVIDDNEFAITLVKRLLSAMRIEEIFTCSNPELALDEMKRAKPDIVLVDLEMPGTSGLELVSDIRAGKGGVRQDVGILVCSAHADREHVTDARNAGASWVVVKPLSFRNLYEGVVRVTLDDRPFIRSEAYNGPCRRIHATPAEQLIAKRRKSDPT